MVVNKQDPDKKPITDFFQYYQSSSHFQLTAPCSKEEALTTIQTACLKNQKIRIRGNSHSFHGMSLPEFGELLIESHGMNHYLFEQDGSITVGSGITVYDLNDFLLQKGYTLSVTNGGDAAPTIGGFISAGGVGTTSCIFGGFWETVLEIRLIDGQGELRTISYEDKLFPWMFGNLGQLGFIVDVKIKIFKSKPDINYPKKEQGKITKNYIHPGDRLCWFTIFTEAGKENEALEFLHFLEEKYANCWHRLDLHKFVLKFISFNPPLLFPRDVPFIALGINGEAIDNKPFDYLAISKLEKEFHNFVISNKHFRRYFQTEFIPKDFDFRAYLGDKVYFQFLELKKQFDPHYIFNRSIIFPPALVED